VAHDWNALLTDATTTFARLVAESDPAAAVPTCDEWCVADLVEHVAGVHQWARHAVLAGTPEGVPEEAPTDLSQLSQWYADHAGDLVETLRDTPADAEAWTFGRGRGTAGWWHRRQTHEVVVHTYDLLTALKRQHEWTVAADLAWDGVLEAIEVFYPRQVRLGRCDPLPGTLRMRATDVPDAPQAVLGDQKPVVDTSGPAAETLLEIWHRRPSTDVEVASLLQHAVTP